MIFTKLTKNLYEIILVVLFSSIFLFKTNFNRISTFASNKNSNNNVYEEIDSYLSTSCENAHFPAMSVTIVNKENVLFSKAFGNCPSTDTPFLLGSVSKSFTALCIMQLVEQGKIDLNGTLSDYLPNATDGDKITILELLNHTSGLGEHQNLQTYKIIEKQGVHNYANVNYSLLGKIIEEVSDLSYENYIVQNIFEPLSMTKSAATLEKSKANGLIEGYQNWFGIQIKTTPKYPKSEDAWISTSAGYLSASTDDLGKYLQMYLNGGNKIISNDSINKMFYENVKVDADIPYSYGMGWTLINEPLPEPVFRHAGLVETGMSTIYLLPEREIGIAIAINANDYFVGKDMMDRIDWSIALMLMGENPNQILNNEYVSKHFFNDFIYFVVFLISVFPLCLIKAYKKNVFKNIFWIRMVLLHFILPLFILLLPKIFFKTPLWVVCSFVPDMFLTIALSSFLLFIGGIIKTILIILNRKAFYLVKD